MLLNFWLIDNWLLNVFEFDLDFMSESVWFFKTPFSSTLSLSPALLLVEEELLNLKRKWFGSNEIIDKKKFLTNDEKDYLKNKSIIKICNIIDLKPLEFKEDNKLQGINIDLLTLMANKLDVTLEYINSKNKNEAIKYLENKSCDILPIISLIPPGITILYTKILSGIKITNKNVRVLNSINAFQK